MYFNSPEFVVFCLLVYGLYLGLSFRHQNYMLLIASYIFYGWWDARFLFLVAFSTTIDFWVGLMIEHGRLLFRQWLLPALFLMLSAVTFLGLDWAALNPLAASNLDLCKLMRLPAILWSLAGSVAFLGFIAFLFWALGSLDDPKRRFRCLMVSLTAQLGLLGVFKY